MFITKSAGAVEYAECISTVKKPTPKTGPGHDIKQSDSEDSALEQWEIWNTPSLPLLPSPHGPEVVEYDRVLSMD